MILNKFYKFGEMSKIKATVQVDIEDSKEKKKYSPWIKTLLFLFSRIGGNLFQAHVF